MVWYCDIPAEPLIRSFSDFTLWCLKKQASFNLWKNAENGPFHTPAEAFIYKLRRVWTLFAVYAQNISWTVYFAPIFKAHPDMKRDNNPEENPSVYF